MDLRFCFCLWTSVLLRQASSAPEPAPRYILNRAELSFHEANDACSTGALTTLRTEQEVQRVLQLLTGPGSDQRRTYWVGLKKVKSECVIQALPLRGFKWVVNNSEETQVSRWLEEPKPTCALQCAALEVHRSNTTHWGLVPVSCKNSFQSICKLDHTQKLKPAVVSEQITSVPEVEPGTVGTIRTARTSPNPTEAPPEYKFTSPTPKEPEPSKASKAPVHNITDPEVLLTRSEELGPKPAFRACDNPKINGSRSLTLDPVDANRILLECFSGVELPLVCSGRPAVWRLLDNSSVNTSSACQPCPSGFKKNSVGKCEDIDECKAGSAGCRHMCQNLDGSFSCFCLDQDGNTQDEDSPECVASQSWIMRILLPVLVVLAVLLLVVVVTVTVKCCMKRRSKERAVKKAEKMAMRSEEDTFQTANETAA